jgi:hypothetical protein
VLGATGGGQFSDTIRFRTQAAKGPLPLHVGSAFRIRRLAVPLPAFLPSVNQIGFDSYEWTAGVLQKNAGKLLLWVTGDGFRFPLYGAYRQDAFQLGLQNITLTFSFGPVPLDRLEFRGRLNKDMTTSGPSLYAEATCATIPNYGPFLPTTTRLCNQDGKLVAGGTFLTQKYAGPANARPKGVAVTSFELTRPSAASDGRAVVTLSRPHDGSILLTDAATGEPVPLDYAAATKVEGNRITLTIKSGTQMPDSIQAWAIADVFPLQSKTF